MIPSNRVFQDFQTQDCTACVSPSEKGVRNRKRRQGGKLLQAINDRFVQGTERLNYLRAEYLWTERLDKKKRHFRFKD